MTDHDLVPASVRLGAVVPPEDPEDWTRPLTWVAALGMLAAALVTAGWLIVAPPTDPQPRPMTGVVAATLAAGGALTGATQLGRVRAFAGTLGGALFGAVATVAVGAALGAAVGTAGVAPGLAHAALASAAGLAGAAGAAVLAAAGPRAASRPMRAVLAIPVAVVLALVATAVLAG